MTELEHAIKHIKTRADAWAVKEVTEALQSISERLDKALSQEPCDNAISRQAVLQAVSEGCQEWHGIYGRCEELINALPSVTQKSGKWILQPSNKEQGERDFIWWKCSECGHVIYSETEKDRREYHAFCGRCGARMNEPQESEE